jgi:hypothetical protein
MELIKKISAAVQGNLTKSYLILANIILVVFAIWFSNVGLLPFKNTGDFALFTLLALILALYRPGWTFVFFIGAIALENINLAPRSFGLMLRPYQFFGALTIIALGVLALAKRLPSPAGEFLPKFRWYDALPVVFALGGFLGSLAAVNKGASFKQAVIAASFVALYFLVRIYVQSLEDLKRIAPFFFSSAIVVAAYGIWQNIRFIHGGNPFEVMAGRPNATFTEPDWLGIYLVFLIAVMYVNIYKLSIGRNKKQETIIKQIPNSKFQIFKNDLPNSLYLVSCFLYLVAIFISLILTVSRSAWLGAALVTISFLKIMLTNGSLKMSEWYWGKFFFALRNLAVVAVGGIAIIYLFNLTRFQLGNRAASTGGLQKITVSCTENIPLPEKIESVDELAQYGCKHINLEEIQSEETEGNFVQEILRNDPNVAVRARIYQTAIKQIRQHPVFGIGWGSISAILGTDDRGAGLNASNIFLEVWLGTGMLGIVSFVVLLGYIFIKGVGMFLDRKTQDKTIAAFVLLGAVAVVVPNLFNSGIFLGFVWVYLAVALSLINPKDAN